MTQQQQQQETGTGMGGSSGMDSMGDLEQLRAQVRVRQGFVELLWCRSLTFWILPSAEQLFVKRRVLKHSDSKWGDRPRVTQQH